MIRVLRGGRWSRRFQLVHADRQARRGGDGLGSRKVLDCFCFKFNDFQKKKILKIIANFEMWNSNGFLISCKK